MPRLPPPPASLTMTIPRARIGSESIAHDAEGQMGYWLRGHDAERNNCFSKIQQVVVVIMSSNTRPKLQQNAIQSPLFWFSKPALFATSGL